MYQPRRRHRNTFVCTFCKRRKVRCDKGNPCSTCLKYGNPHCEYISDSHNGHAPGVADAAGVAKEPLRLQSSALTASSYANGAPLLKPAAQSELEMLKQKIRMLEQLVSYSRDLDAHPPHVAWHGEYRSPVLSLLGYNPCASDDETFSFHDNYVPFLSMHSTGNRYCAPLSWIALVKVDNAVSLMFSYKRKNVIIKRLLAKELTKDPETLKPSERFFQEKITDEASLNEDSLFADAKVIRHVKDKVDFRKRINEKARAVGLTVFEGDLEEARETLDKIQMILPTLKVIWMLIDRFFVRVYPFFPFIDQFDFEDNMVRILGSKSRAHEKVTKFHIEKRMDVVYLALLLMVLRFGYLTLFTNSDAINESNLRTSDPSQRAQEIKFLMLNPIDIDFVDVAQMCLLQFGYLRVSNIPLLQLSLYMKLYYSFAPENGDSPEDTNSQSYTSMLINMAVSLGFHREPDKFKVKVRDDRTSNLCRKIWYYLLVIDLHSGMSNGFAPCAHREMFDTSPPYFKPGNENVRDVEVEKEAINALRRIDRCFDDLNAVVRIVSSIGSLLNLKSLCQLLSSLEIEYIKDQRPFTFEPGSLRMVPIDVPQAINTKIYFQANFFLVSVAFHLFNYYERNKQIDLAYFYLKKVVAVSIFNTMPFYEDFVDKSHIWFQNSTDLAVTPSFQALVHKCMIVVQAIMARARFSQLQCETLPSHLSDLANSIDYKNRYELLVETFSLCDQCLTCFVETLSKLSSRYYYSWRCLKAYEGLRGAREGTDYYLNYCKGKEGYMLLSNEMLADLNGVLRESLEVVKRNQLTKPTQETTNVATDDMFGSKENGLSSTSVAPDTPSAYAPENIDNLWMQMMSMKPQMNKSVLFSHTPPTMDLDVSLGSFDFNTNFFDDTFISQDNNFNLFEAAFDEPIRLDL